MPILAGPLKTAFQLARESFAPKPKFLGIAYSQAIIAMWSLGFGPLGGAVIAVPAQATLSNDLSGIFDTYYPTPQAVAADVSLAVDDALKSILVVGGLDGALTGPISGQVSATLRSGIFTVWEPRDPAIQSITSQEADLIVAFTVSGIAVTTGIPPSPPGQGPLQ